MTTTTAQAQPNIVFIIFTLANPRGTGSKGCFWANWSLTNVLFLGNPHKQYFPLEKKEEI